MEGKSQIDGYSICLFAENCIWGHSKSGYKRYKCL